MLSIVDMNVAVYRSHVQPVGQVVELFTSDGSQLLEHMPPPLPRAQPIAKASATRTTLTPRLSRRAVARATDIYWQPRVGSFAVCSMHSLTACRIAFCAPITSLRCESGLAATSRS